MTLYLGAQSTQFVNLRVTFKNSPIHILEKFAFSDMFNAHQYMLNSSELNECIILQTCNRVEVYGVGSDPQFENIIKRWSDLVDLNLDQVRDNIVVSQGEDAIRHLVKLTSGLDSLVVGEDQILGQVKRSLDFSRKNGFAGPNLNALFDKTIKIGSKVRILTGINKGSTSVGSMAVNLAYEYFDDIKEKEILLIGSGEGASLVAKSLKQRGMKFFVTSRTFERARSFADTVAGAPIPFESALEKLNENIDIVFISTVAPYYLLTYERISNMMKNRKKGLMIFDLSNPRTVEDKIATLNNIKLVNMDQISEIVEKNVGRRKKEIQSAEKIIDEEIITIKEMLKRKSSEPAVITIFKNADSIRNKELKKALSLIGNRMTENDIRILEQFSYALVEGILSTPMNNLRKEFSNNKNENELINLALKLFNYEKP
ncbi:glutamyl-tRNA reductase [Candidatus Nitrosocosmicus agrestis]|jgi:glutamyl-tRNA reductase|uniref:glutamyl-tRNA reductase n=1 Tax=Candidatus Nitrosocosmicus agrestis TaxID=2563600 RepID=UPI00122E9572|nr:glutamyl-tRNA reductase [Candidatus Nitrosocosmicus sp. SS]KAA2283054.1 glutamyl-tRNA reductase [Candidatus Nitrosocosmicus sp. SS]KAF0868513.1 glutamyl-tRNA reductase [Candidatus Nitrosocosmicus sp. SS]MDR4490099.1 glutamyl-tRNA reductase [Candidatus Nitrosocosmicus sp.]